MAVDSIYPICHTANAETECASISAVLTVWRHVKRIGLEDVYVHIANTFLIIMVLNYIQMVVEIKLSLKDGDLYESPDGLQPDDKLVMGSPSPLQPFRRK